MTEQERRELIDKQKTNQFVKKLQEKVNKEDWIAWAKDELNTNVKGERR